MMQKIPKTDKRNQFTLSNTEPALLLFFVCTTLTLLFLFSCRTLWLYWTVWLKRWLKQQWGRFLLLVPTMLQQHLRKFKWLIHSSPPLHDDCIQIMFYITSLQLTVSKGSGELNRPRCFFLKNDHSVLFGSAGRAECRQSLWWVRCWDRCFRSCRPPRSSLNRSVLLKRNASLRKPGQSQSW